MNDYAEHLGYRNQRQQHADITNKRLLGLSTVEINPTELCNRTCSFCPRSDPNVYPNRNLNMTVATAKALADQLYADNFTGDIHVTGWGEPTLNPNILEIIKQFSKYFFTEMITNGDRIISGKMTHESLTEHGLNSIIVDCYDGPEQTATVTKLLENFAGKQRIRNNYDTGEAGLLDTYNFNNRGGTLGEVETMLRPCWMPMYKAFIDWNGDVGLCCNDWARRQDTFGNINKQTFSDIWMNQAFTNVRKKLLHGDREQPACKSCNTNGCKSGEGSAKLWNENIHRMG